MSLIRGSQPQVLGPMLWANRPAATNVRPGTEMVVSDYAYQKWVSDGTYWRPAQGRAVLKGIFGLIAAGGQIAQLSGTTAGLFTIPGGGKIPAGMIIPHSRLAIQTDGFKSGANGTANFLIYLGTNNSTADSIISTQGISIGNGTNVIASSAARFSAANDRFNTRNWQGEGVSSGSNASMIDRIVNINTTADMWVNIGINTANALDVFNLTTLQIVLEA